MTQIVEVKTAELIGAALDWAVAVVLEREYGEGRVVKVCRVEATFPAWIERENSPGSAPYYHRFSPSTDWSQGGQLIEKHRMLFSQDFGMFTATAPGSRAFEGSGKTHLIAAMRCLVASKLGGTVEVPKELLP